ncbi:MAG: iron ABC transporter permease [Bacteroidota bacterium]
MKRLWLLLFLGISLALSTLISLFLGAYALDYKQVIGILSLATEGADQSLQYLIWNIRLPRILLCVLVGGGLAIAGAGIQGLFRNPLADPTLLGITSGAMVFAAFGIVFASTLLVNLTSMLGYSLIAFLSFIGSVLCTIIVYRLGTWRGTTSVATMLLAGIAITALCGAITGLLTYISDEDQLRDITFWTLGSMAAGNWKVISILLPCVLLPSLLLLRLAQPLNILMLGEREAEHLGVNLQRLKWAIIICVALIVGVCVAVSGIIGFIALVVPHLIRLMIGPKHQSLMIGSMLLGAILMLWADNAARTIIAPAELPVGILTAMFGAPFFIGLLLQSKKVFAF